MKIEEAVKQTKPFSSSLGKAIVNAIYTGSFILEHQNRIFKEFEINDQHYNILRILNGAYPKSMCPGEIKRVLLNKRGDLTRLIDKLVKLGYVDRQLNEENRRMMDVRINQKGIEFVEKVTKKLQKEDIFRGNLTRDEAETLNDLLDKLRG